MSYKPSWKRSACAAGGISLLFGGSVMFLQPETDLKAAAYLAGVTAIFAIPTYYAIERYVGLPMLRLSSKITRWQRERGAPTTLDIYKKD